MEALEVAQKEGYTKWTKRVTQSGQRGLHKVDKEGYTKWTKMRHYRGIYTVWCEK